MAGRASTADRAGRASGASGASRASRAGTAGRASRASIRGSGRNVSIQKQIFNSFGISDVIHALFSLYLAGACFS